MFEDLFGRRKAASPPDSLTPEPLADAVAAPVASPVAGPVPLRFPAVAAPAVAPPAAGDSLAVEAAANDHDITIDGETALARKLVADENATPAYREQYLRLAAALHQLHPEGLSSVLVTSAMPGEGKTLTAVNLALTFSQSYRRDVLLIDADLRHPSLHRVFGLENRGGLTEVLAGNDGRGLRPLEVAPRLSLLTAGEATDDPVARLTSVAMKRLLAKAPESFHWVIVDTPAMAAAPDAGLLASMVDGVLVVISARSTRFQPVKRAIQVLGRSRVVGVVLNRADAGVLRSQAGACDRYYRGHPGR